MFTRHDFRILWPRVRSLLRQARTTNGLAVVALCGLFGSAVLAWSVSSHKPAASNAAVPAKAAASATNALAEASPAPRDPCERQAWPYYDPRCTAAGRSARRPTRDVRVMTSDGDTKTVAMPVPVVAPKPATAPQRQRIATAPPPPVSARAPAPAVAALTPTGPVAAPSPTPDGNSAPAPTENEKSAPTRAASNAVAKPAPSETAAKTGDADRQAFKADNPVAAAKNAGEDEANSAKTMKTATTAEEGDDQPDKSGKAIAAKTKQRQAKSTKQRKQSGPDNVPEDVIAAVRAAPLRAEGDVPREVVSEVRNWRGGGQRRAVAEDDARATVTVEAPDAETPRVYVVPQESAW
ncbi:MAG TPA: hypothetical protein VFA53_07365 [Xanthobacteraceae bacterium]|nr:hypothetical protein [Xanthobacteraceae bacterium]